jgi:GDP-4-dehydro-6-deoxy-D-mannose reductase
MKVLVTGAAGFAGSHLLEQLAGHHELLAWSRSAAPSDVSRLAAWTRIDLLDRARVRQAIGELRPDAVFHCAGAPHVGDSWHHTSEPLATNVLTTHHLLEAIRRANLRCRVLITGSGTVYAPRATPVREDDAVAPSSPYALSKLAQEQLGWRGWSEDGIDVVLTRAFNHTGPRQRSAFSAPAFARQVALIERGVMEPLIKVGNLEAQRDFTDVRDVVRAYALLMDRGTPGTIYNVASGVARPIRAVLDGLAQRSHVAMSITIDPARLRPNDTPILVGDASRLTATTGWRAEISFDRMLDDLLEYWRALAA